jgi:probable phosphoglycerate mutase
VQLPRSPHPSSLTAGETEWTKTGQYTGKTDIALTERGARQVTSTARRVVGDGKLIDPSKLIHVWVSPRKRALHTFELLLGDDRARLSADDVTVTEDIAEWDYGEYEGLVVQDIHQRRKQQGLDREKPFSVWRDGCEGGE